MNCNWFGYGVKGKANFGGGLRWTVRLNDSGSLGGFVMILLIDNCN